MQDLVRNVKFLATYLIILLSLLTVSNISAQGISGRDLSDSLANQLELYGLKTQSPVLFIHFDKNVYTNNENVWFTAYFLKPSDQKAYKVLSIALVRDDDHLIVFNDKFLATNGFATGNTVIPDTTAAGHYSFIAYGNRLLNGKPDVLFIQRVTIKRDVQSGYIASLNPLDTSLAITHQKVMLSVSSNDPKEKTQKTSVSYYLGNSAQPVMKGNVRITQAGQYVFDIPTAMLRQGENRLNVRVKQGDEVKDLNIDLPALPQPAVLNFFPEGGNLVTGLPNVVAWEAKSHAGQGLATDAILYENKTIIDTIHANSYGFGRFTLKPKTNAQYSVRLMGGNIKDTLYRLPKPVSHIPVLHVPEAVAGNLLSITLYADKPQRVYLNLHNYAQLFSSTPISLDIGEKKISILLNEMPRGLTQATVTDSLGRPLIERLFFARYDKKQTLQIKTDKTSYKPREKITLSLKLGNAGLSENGLVSIACIQENRVSVKNKNDIESYFYLKSQLGDLPVKENYLGNNDADKFFLEDILLIKGWRRYTWLDILKTVPNDTVTQLSDLVFKGLVTNNGSKIKKPVEVVNANDPFNLIPTDSAGNFTVEAERLIVERNKKLNLFVNRDAKQETYLVNLIDPYLLTSENVVKDLVFTDQNAPQQPNTQLLEMTGLDRAFTLKEVQIKGRKGLFFANGANECGDYVCINQILNCANHRNAPGNLNPKIGHKYLSKGNSSVAIVYKGCGKNGVLDGVFAAQEFYPADLSQRDSPPEYISTLYWNYLTKVTSLDTAEFSFYSNDITGKFKVIVQGVTGKDIIYGEQAFEVLKDK